MARNQFPRLNAAAFLALAFMGDAYAATIGVPADRPTIAAAIAAAEDNDTIRIAAGTYRERLTVNRSLIFQGDTAGGTIIEPDADGRVFIIAAGATVQMNDLTVQNGRGVNRGAGIHNSGNLTLARCTISGNTTQAGTSLGAGIYNERGATLDIRGCLFEKNILVDSGPYIGGGGAIFSWDSLSIADTVFRDNATSKLFGGVFAIGHTTVVRCTFTRNSAAGGSSLNLSGTETGPYQVSDCTFTENLAQGAGSALHANGNGSVANCTFSHNNGNTVYIYPYGRGTATFSNCIFSDNISQNLGTALTSDGQVLLQHCSFTANVTTSFGGAISLRTGHTALTDCTFTSNRAGTGAGGGAIYVYRSSLEATGCTFSGNGAGNQAGAINNEEGQVSLTDCTFSQNHVDGAGGGGAILSLSFNTGFASMLTLIRCTLSRNTAPYGGALVNQDGLVSLSDSTLDGNIARNDGQGGALMNVLTNQERRASLSISRSRITNNTAANYAGGLLNIDGDVFVVDSTLGSNHAFGGGLGGALLNVAQVPSNPATVAVSRSAIVANTAEQGGGGLFTQEGIVRLTNCTLSGNRANGAGDGGAVLNVSLTLGVPSLLTLVNCTVADNTSSTANGGGIATGTEAGPATTHLMNTILAGNTSPSLRDSLGGQTVSDGNNLSTDAPDALSLVTDRKNTDPLLGPLADNGGPTMTHALLAGSPAIDAGTAAGAPSSDQRFFTRPAGASVDIGSFEYAAVPVGLTGADAGKALRIAGGLQAATQDDTARLDLVPGSTPGRITTEDVARILRRLGGLD